MVIERFKNGDPRPVGKRFREAGRTLPDCVRYHKSWIDATGGRCFQIMEAADAESLSPWLAYWRDLVDFEIIPIVSSSEFWAGIDVD